MREGGRLVAGVAPSRPETLIFDFPFATAFQISKVVQLASAILDISATMAPQIPFLHLHDVILYDVCHLSLS